MQAFQAIREATLNARKRTLDNSISVSVKGGKFNVEFITFPKAKRGHCDKVTLKSGLSAQEAILFLNAMQ